MANNKKTQKSVDETKTKQVKATSSKESKSGNKVSADKTKKNTKAKSSNKNEKKITTNNENTKKEATAKVSVTKAESKNKNNVQVDKKPKTEIELEEKTNSEITEEEKKVVNTENKKQLKEAQKQKEKKEKQEKNQIKIDNQKAVSTPPVSADEMTRLVKIILVLVVIVVAFYGLTVLITKFKKSSSGDRDTTVIPAVIQYDRILIGSLLKQPRDEYYVLIQADDDPYQMLTSYYLTSYESTTGALKVYTANINDGLNSYYVSDTSSIRPENMKDFRVSDVTLIYVKNHKITESYEGIEGVTAALKVLVNSNKILNLN